MTNSVIDITKDSRVVNTHNKRKVHIGGENKELDVYKIPLDLLHYNEENGRISTSISRYKSELSKLNRRELDDRIQEFLIQENLKSFTKTKEDIRIKGQQLPGVVMSDGRIIDGNRRFSCLRVLNENGDFPTFLAGILPADTDPLVIKTFELEIQNEDKKVDYDPINDLYVVYKYLIKDGGIMNTEKYHKLTGIPKKEVEKKEVKAQLLVDFLDSIEADPEDFYIAKDLKLDGSLDEIQKKIKKLKENKDKWKKAKVILNDTMLLTDKGDRARNFRDFIDDIIIKNKNFDNFYEEYEPLSMRLHDKLEKGRKNGGVTTEFIRKNIRSDRELNKEINDLLDGYEYEVNVNKSANKPIEFLKKINVIFGDFEKNCKGSVPKMRGHIKDEFMKELNKIEDYVKDINNLIDNNEK